jgi:hypothetical protein
MASMVRPTKSRLFELEKRIASVESKQQATFAYVRTKKDEATQQSNTDAKRLAIKYSLVLG